MNNQELLHYYFNNNPKIKELFLLIGASGSGKSRFTAAKDKHFIVSSDVVRLELFGTLARQEKEDHEKVFENVNRKIDFYLSTGPTVYDATNLNRKKRKHFYKDVFHHMLYGCKGKDKTLTAVVFIEPYEVIRKNNLNKPKEERVPIEALKRMYSTVQIPRIGVDCEKIIVEGQTDFFQPGMTYAKLLRVNSLKEFIEYVNIPYRTEMKNLFGPHDTPYHLESIEEHIDMCIENAGDDEVLKIAGIFHDLGKSFTKNGGKYLNHQFVSAMYAMKAFSEIPDMPEEIKEVILEIIYQHMNAHLGLSEKLIRNNNLDEKTVELIFEFAEIDDKSRITEKVR
jgi:predicted kinase